MDPEAVRVAQKLCPVPYTLQKPLKKWLQTGSKEDISESPRWRDNYMFISSCPTQVQVHECEETGVKSSR